MKITKFLFLSVLMLGLFSFSSYAGDPVAKNNKYTKVTNQIAKLLDGLDVSSIKNDETIKIDFMISSTGEIIVLSTNSEELDEELKSKLNYIRKTLQLMQVTVFIHMNNLIKFPINFLII